eukprot:7686237-Pyramimonas_sp.AAC.1
MSREAPSFDSEHSHAWKELYEVPGWVLIKSKAFGLPPQYSAINIEFEALSSLCEAIFSVT